jgi:hypothetical protein
VLICPDDVRVTGLGVARALESAGAQAPVRRPYAAPERVAGASPDRRADVFSLATLAHELLWGRRVAAIGSEGASSLADLPGARMDALRPVFAKALAEDPASRFATALDFAEALKDSVTSRTALGSPGVESPESRVESQESSVEIPESRVLGRRLTVDAGGATTDYRLPTPDSRPSARLPLDLDDLRAEPDDAVPPVQVKAPPPVPRVQEEKPAALYRLAKWTNGSNRGKRKRESTTSFSAAPKRRVSTTPRSRRPSSRPAS